MRSHQTIHYQFSNLPIPIEMGNARPLVEPNLPQLVLAETSIYSERYRFGFNGKEKDDEIQGDGNAYDYGARIYDCRLGRWLSLDLKYGKAPGWSPYRFGFDNPVRFIDKDGKKQKEAVSEVSGASKVPDKYRTVDVKVKVQVGVKLNGDPKYKTRVRGMLEPMVKKPTDETVDNKRTIAPEYSPNDPGDTRASVVLHEFSKCFGERNKGCHTRQIHVCIMDR